MEAYSGLLPEGAVALDDDLVRFRAESINSVGVKTEIMLDIDCELGNLLLNDGELGVPVSEVMIQPHLGNPRRLDISWPDESEQLMSKCVKTAMCHCSHSHSHSH